MSLVCFSKWIGLYIQQEPYGWITDQMDNIFFILQIFSSRSVEGIKDKFQTMYG